MSALLNFVPRPLWKVIAFGAVAYMIYIMIMGEADATKLMIVGGLAGSSATLHRRDPNAPRNFRSNLAHAFNNVCALFTLALVAVGLHILNHIQYKEPFGGMMLAGIGLSSLPPSIQALFWALLGGLLGADPNAAEDKPDNDDDDDF